MPPYLILHHLGPREHKNIPVLSWMSYHPDIYCFKDICVFFISCWELLYRIFYHMVPILDVCILIVNVSTNITLWGNFVQCILWYISWSAAESLRILYFILNRYISWSLAESLCICGRQELVSFFHTLHSDKWASKWQTQCAISLLKKRWSIRCQPPINA